MPHEINPIAPGVNPEGDREEIRAPFDRQPIATIGRVGVKGVKHALDTADRLARNPDALLPADERISILSRAADILTERRDDLALEAAREGGKPLIDSRVEADRALDGVRSCIEVLRTQHGSEIPMNLNASSANRFAFTTHQPIGVVVAFSAFNHPINLIIHQVCPAIATGCPVIIKPAEATPISCYSVVNILREAGLPDGWCQALNTDTHDTAAALAGDNRVRFFSFIGSQKVGWKLRSQLAPGARCALEHGGVAPVIFAQDADLDDAVPLLARGGFYHAGQVCVSVQRIFAEQAVAKKLADRLAAAANDQIVGDPTSPDTTVGPLIRPGEVQRVDEWVTEAIDKGATALCGGEPISETCYKPTVLLDPPDDVRVSTEEAFGPVVCVYSVDSIDEGVNRANALPYAFQAAVMTRDIDVAAHCARRLNAAAVMINDHTAFRVDWMPFGGHQLSGLGVGGIQYTMKDMQIEKLVVMRTRDPRS